MLKRKKQESLTSFKMDSKGHCFLCLERIRTLPQFNLEEPSASLPPLHSLQDFARFLKLDMGKVFQAKGHLLPPRLRAKVERSKLDVELCAGCVYLTESFSKRFRALELMEMEVLEGMRLIQRKLVEAGESGRTEEFRNFVGDSLIQGTKRNGMVRNLGVLEGLREGAIEKCSRKLSRCRPQVLINKLPSPREAVVEKVQFDPIVVSKTYTRKNPVSYGNTTRPPRHISLPVWGSKNAQGLPVKMEVEINPEQIHGGESLGTAAGHGTGNGLEQDLPVVKDEPEVLQDAEAENHSEVEDSLSPDDGESMIWPFSGGDDEGQSEDPLALDEPKLVKQVRRRNSRTSPTRPTKKRKRTTTASDLGEKQKPRRRSKSGTKKYHERYSDCPSNSNFRLKCPDCGLLFQLVKNFLLHRKESKSCGASSSYDPRANVKVEVLVPEGEAIITGDDDKSIFTHVLAIVDLPQEVFTCEDCGLALYSSEDLEAHGPLHGSFSCNFCPVQESYAPNLSFHELQQHATRKVEKVTPPSGRIGSYPCARCDHVCSDRTMYMHHHLGDHLSLSMNEPKCPICKINANNVKEGQLAQHFATHHNLAQDALPPEGVHRCQVENCPAYFTNAKYLTVHLKLRHNIKAAVRKTMWKGSHKCGDCDMVFSYRHHLKRHRLALHVTPEQLIPCSVKNCHSLFESKKELEWHMKRASAHHKFLKEGGSVPASCTICNKTFDARHLKIHIKSHMGGGKVTSGDGDDSVVCHVCGKSFRDKKKRYCHSLTHSNPENWKHRCTVCDKKFRTKVFLDGHMAMHTRESKFVCEICGRRYRHNCGLFLHKKLKHSQDGGKYHHLRMQKRRATDAARRLRLKKMSGDTEDVGGSCITRQD